MATVPAICEAAAAAFETAAPALARDALITAFERAFGARMDDDRNDARPSSPNTPTGCGRPPGDSSVSGLVLAALGDSGSATGAGRGPETAVG